MIPLKINNLIDSFSRLPGIGRKTAEKFVFYLLKQPKECLEKFSQNIEEIKNSNFYCPECFNFTEQENSACSICRNPSREKSLICVIEEISELNVIEKTAQYSGLYHVLGGKIDPIEGQTPGMLKIPQLIERIKRHSAKEIILALNPDIQGEGTILYLKKILLPLNVKLTLLARGIPMGGEIEYADEITLSNAIKGRQEIK